MDEILKSIINMDKEARLKTAKALAYSEETKANMQAVKDGIFAFELERAQQTVNMLRKKEEEAFALKQKKQEQKSAEAMASFEEKYKENGELWAEKLFRLSIDTASS